MTIHYQDDALTLLHGDAHQMLTTMQSGSVGCIVTSPPYYNLRDYGEEGQLGTETTPTEYITALTNVFNEARRVLTDDGTFWLNIGDSYGPDKNLMGTPWRVAFALQDDGWILRNSIIWHKTSAMPEAVTDRFSTKHESLSMFSKSRTYWFDLDAVREPHDFPDVRRTMGTKNRQRSVDQRTLQVSGHHSGKNPGDVWSIAPTKFAEAHFATMPPALAERCILAGAKPDTTVLDPFSGSGTTGMVAAKHGRRYVGIDLNKTYLDLSITTRLAQPGLDLEGTLA